VVKKFRAWVACSVLFSTVIAGCGVRDADGCWKDAEAAYDAISAMNCGTAHCFEDLPADTEERCLEEEEQKKASRREIWCFNGCKVDQLLESIELFSETCADEDYDAMYTLGMEDGPFYDYTDETRDCGPDNMGW
jgi:hypothetical protein